MRRAHARLVGRALACLAAAATLAPADAGARPRMFAEGLVGFSFALGTKGYLEEREGMAVLHTGVRGGAWLGGTRHGRIWGVELEVDRSGFTSAHTYVKRYQDESGNPVSELVEPTYSRVRALAGARLYLPIRGPVGWTLRGGAGIDRVTGTVKDLSPVVEIGGQLAVRLGPVRLGIEATFATAFHDNEYYDGVMLNHYQPGFDRTVDLISCITAGGVF